MSRPWNPNNRPWLSPEAYAALSPAERKALWLDRKAQRARRGKSFRQLHRSMPKGAKAGLVLVAAASVGVSIGAYQAFGPRDIIADEVAARPSETVQESVAPQFSDSDADAEWAARGDPPSSRAVVKRLRASIAARLCRSQ